MAELRFQKDINASKLLGELKESGLYEKVQELRTKGDQIFVFTSSDLTPEEEGILQAVITEHTKEDDLEIDIEAAKDGIFFGINLLAELSVLLREHGLSSPQLLEVVGRFSAFQQLIYGGYLALAKDELLKIEIDDHVSQELIELLVNKIQTKIGLLKFDSSKIEKVIDG